MRKSLKFLPALVATAWVSLGPPALAQAVDQKLGKVHFETSCTPEAAAAFDQGMLYQHSFWYRASQREFNKALKADPGCGIAYWGIALSLLWNPHAAPPVKNLADGAAALAKGERGWRQNPNESADYIIALSAMYADYQTVDHHTRVLNYMKAMEQLAAKYPSDDEAQMITRSRSMSELRPRIRPMPINSRARRYSRRSGNGSRITQAFRII